MQASAPANIYFVTGPSMQPDYGDDNGNFDHKEARRQTYDKMKEKGRQPRQERTPQRPDKPREASLQTRPNSVVRDIHDDWDVHRGRRSNSRRKDDTIPVAPDLKEERIAECQKFWKVFESTDAHRIFPQETVDAIYNLLITMMTVTNYPELREKLRAEQMLTKNGGVNGVFLPMPVDDDPNDDPFQWTRTHPNI